MRPVKWLHRPTLPAAFWLFLILFRLDRIKQEGSGGEQAAMQDTDETRKPVPSPPDTPWKGDVREPLPPPWREDESDSRHLEPSTVALMVKVIDSSQLTQKQLDQLLGEMNVGDVIYDGRDTIIVCIPIGPGAETPSTAPDTEEQKE